MIIFVYDTGYCQTEEDDPQKAVLFFHPKWVSDQQRLALCGQLMGAAQFCSSVFSTPQVLTLQSGKFILKKFDQYILSVGSDQTLPDWILNERFQMLQSLIEFYHKSFDSILISVNSDYKLFTKKLYEILEVYSPIIQYIVSTFGNLQTIKFPRKKSTMFLEAFQLLESCCNFEGVLGGTILHNNRVIATLLDSNVTKILALTDPHRVKSSAEPIQTPFHLPLGVQLLKVYVKQSAFEIGILKPSLSNGVTKKQDSGSDVKPEFTKIFTVPEEEHGSTVKCTNQERTVKDTVAAQRSKSIRKHCKSKIENALKERSKSFVANHNNKICSTPTIENKVVHEDLLSICSNPKVDSKPVNQCQSSNPSFAADPIKRKTKFPPSKHTYNNICRLTMDDLMIDFTYKNCPVPLRYYSFGLPKICSDVEQTMKEEEKKRKLYRTRFYKTIADPSNPVFRYDGFPVSKSLYNHCLDEHYKDFIAANITIDSREEFIKKKNMENELFKLKMEKAAASNTPKEKPTLPQVASITDNNNVQAGGAVALPQKEHVTNKNQKLFRRSLTLPLKPVSQTGAETSVPVAKNKVLHARTPTTPLMTKLSLLVLEEQNESRGSAQQTQQQQQPRSKSKLVKDIPVKRPKSLQNKSSDVISCGLFVCGQENLTVLLLLDENSEQSPDLILSLWELCTTNLERVEQLRNRSIDSVASGAVSSSYSFLSLDPQWGTMQKSGAWGSDEMKVVGSLHQDMIQAQNITEVIVRNEDAVIYGYRCGNTETFYHQGGCSAVGLPTPADLMGVVPLKARRRLERDHGIILL